MRTSSENARDETNAQAPRLPPLRAAPASRSSRSFRSLRFRLRYARSDAISVVEALGAGGKALFRRGIEHKLLTDAAATKKGILAGLKWLQTTSQPEDVAVVFIAAHGETVDDQYYLLPQDVRFTGLDALVDQGISQSALMDAIHRIRARKVVVLLDTCKSGAVAHGFGTRGLAEKRALAVLAKASGVYLIAASTAQQAAVEDSDLGHGVFTWSLVEGLKGGADLDGDRAVSIRELVTYVESEVARISPRCRRPALCGLRSASDRPSTAPAP